jgi:hypothetical protein
MKGVLPWLVRWARRADTRVFLSCLGCSYNMFFLTLNYFTSFVPFSQQAGQGAIEPSRLSESLDGAYFWIYKKPAICKKDHTLLLSL